MEFEGHYKSSLSDSREMRNTKNVYIIYVGGTIGMKKTLEGYAPVANYLQQQINAMPEFQDTRMPNFFINEYSPLLDSSDMDMDDWKRIATDISDHYDQFDGFVVLHGTDTMAYTASALSFMLQNLSKPVILTGSQIPLSEIRNDGRYNIISSVMIAGTFEIPEVCIFFDDNLLRGNRSKKVDIWGMKAFESLNYPVLATVGINIEVSGSHILPMPTEKFVLKTECSAEVVAIRLFPGISAKVISDLLKGSNIKGVVLEAYGSGNFPERKQDFLQVIQSQIEQGLVVVIVSQVHKGTVNMEQYKTGVALKKAGVISGYDMTVEAALTKLQFLIGQQYSTEDIKRLMKTNIAGEFTPPTSHTKELTNTTVPPDLPQCVVCKEISVPLQYHSSYKYFRPEEFVVTRRPSITPSDWPL